MDVFYQQEIPDHWGGLQIWIMANDGSFYNEGWTISPSDVDNTTNPNPNGVWARLTHTFENDSNLKWNVS